jgi:hypothetical protein
MNKSACINAPQELTVFTALKGGCVIKSIVEMGESEQLETIKDRLGWEFGGVRPIDWNPWKHVGHLGFLLTQTIKFNPDIAGQFFYDTIDDTEVNILMMPFTVEGRKRLVELCGGFLGVWHLSDERYFARKADGA